MQLMSLLYHAYVTVQLSVVKMLISVVAAVVRNWQNYNTAGICKTATTSQVSPCCL